MDLKKARKILGKGRQTAEFKIPIGQCLLAGLKILNEYDENIEITREDFALHISNFTNTVAKMTEQEVKEMCITGWSEDEESNSWSFPL